MHLIITKYVYLLASYNTGSFILAISTGCCYFLQRQNCFTYKVKIINPAKKSDVVMRELHHFRSKFDSVLMLRAKLVEELRDQVPDSMTFKVGYLEGQKNNRMSIMNQDDIKAMYLRYKTGEITLWCEGKVDDVGRGNKRKREEQVSSKYHEREDEAEMIYQQLKEKHADKFDNAQFRLWARMVASNIHSSIVDPPSIPVFGLAKKPRRDSNNMANAVTGAAVALVNALSSKSDCVSEQATNRHPEHNNYYFTQRDSCTKRKIFGTIALCQTTLSR